MTYDNGWYDDESQNEEVEYPLHEYELSSAPNDFNILTLYNFIESGTVKVPGFQRNYVWDIRRASKLIESIIIGLPVPQIFLYEEARNRFLVIDGQQRLMSVYYFIKQRFPRQERRTELRKTFDAQGKIPDDLLENETYFQKFNLSLPPTLSNQRNKFHKLNYENLGDEYRSSFDLRTIRSFIVKQISPKNDDSAIYEIFNRLNSGGMNLRPQEIRMSLYHSKFYEMLSHINLKPEWRELIDRPDPDLHLRDLEFLLRGFALLMDAEDYSSSMSKFLNQFSSRAKTFEQKKVDYLKELFSSFLKSCSLLRPAIFQKANRFSITYFESLFVATCKPAYENKRLVSGKIDPQSVEKLKGDQVFSAAAERTTTSKANVSKRLQRALDIIKVQ